jgi:hypothetical protein
MEIEQLRQEINDLLENVVQHSNSYTAKEHLSSLDVSFVQKKVNKVQERLTVLKYLLEAKHDERGERRFVTNSAQVEQVTVEEVEPEVVVVEAPPVVFEPEELPKENIQEPVITEVKEETLVEEVAPVQEIVEEISRTKFSEGLTLNDRYLYANELFNKDMNAFNELVKSIDACTTLDQAIALYSSSDWELDNEHVISFTNLVERSFS